MTNTTTKKGAVKGTVAAAAGIAVLLGGAGTFALWNQSGSIGTAGTSTGALTATFGDMEWTDQAQVADGTIENIAAFRMVPGDTLVGTSDIDVTATGENLKVLATLDTATGALPEGVTATVDLSDGTTDGESITLQGTNGGATIDLTATVTLKFDESVGDDVTGDGSAQPSMNQPINLQDVKVKLQQVAPASQG